MTIVSMTRLRLLLVLPFLALIATTTCAAGYRVGDVVAPFTLKNIDGKMVSTPQRASDKGYIVVFTCNHCPFAKMYEERIMQLDKEFASKGFPVVAINSNDVSQVPDDSFENMAKRSNEKHYSFPYLYDETQAVVNAFGATKTPHVFVVTNDAKGMMVRYIGAIDNNPEDAAKADQHYVRDAVNALLGGNAVSVTQTKAIGCSIKMKKG